MREIAGDSPVPVVLHLDHGKDLDMIKKCVEMGWTSVMIDWSDKPFDANLEAVPQGRRPGDQSREHRRRGGDRRDPRRRGRHGRRRRVHYTDPSEAEKFCRELDLAAFAAAIGTAHGYYKGEPDVKFDLIGEINRRTNTPMALHGGTGLSDEIIQKCIKLGCAKINISTNLKHVFIDSFVDYHKAKPTTTSRCSVLAAQFEALKQLFKEKIAQFGGAESRQRAAVEGRLRRRARSR